MISKLTRLLLTLLVVAGLLAACGTANMPLEESARQQEPLALRLRLQPGDVYRYRTRLHQEMAYPDLPEMVVMTAELAYTLRYQVKEVAADGAIRVRATYEAIAFSLAVGEERIAFPGDDRIPGEQSPKVLSAMIDQSALLLLAPDGSLRRVEELSPALEPLVGARAEDLLVTRMLEPPFDAGAGTREMQLGLSLVPLPASPVELGGTWTEQRPVSSLEGAPTYTVTHTLQERADGIATIALAGAIAAPTVLEPLLGHQIDLATLSQTGTTTLEEATGLPLSSELHLQLELREPLVTEVFTDPSVTQAPIRSVDGEPAPTATLPPSPTPAPGELMRFASSVFRERIACCDPLPQPTAAPTRTPLPLPTAAELEELVRSGNDGVVVDTAVVESREVLGQLLVIYRGQLAEGYSPDPEATPGADRTVLNYTVFEHGPAGWHGTAASFGGLLGRGGERYPLRFDHSSSFGMRGGYAFVLGQSEAAEIATVEGRFDNGQVVRAQVAGPDVHFLLVAKGASALCELRTLDAGGGELERIVPQDDLHGPCPWQTTPTPVR